MSERKFWEQSHRIWDVIKKSFVPEWLIGMGCWWEQTQEVQGLLNNPFLGQQEPKLGCGIINTRCGKIFKR